MCSKLLTLTHRLLCRHTGRLTRQLLVVASIWVSACWMTIATAEIYKSVDEHGNVTFSDVAPPATPVESISPPEPKNIIDSEEEIEQRQADWLSEAQRERKSKEERQREVKANYQRALSQWSSEYKAAKQALASAQAALKKGIVVEEGDFVGKAGGGARPSEQYFAKEQALKDAVIDAKRNLKRVKAAKPEAP